MLCCSSVSSNPAEDYNFVCENCFEKNEKPKRGRAWRIVQLYLTRQDKNLMDHQAEVDVINKF